MRTRLALMGLVGSAVVALGALAGCAATDQERPAPLTKKFVNRVSVTRVWHAKLRREAPKLRLGLGVAVADGRVFVASHDGVVEARSLQNGRLLWRRRVRAALSGGPGVGAGLVVLGSSKGEIVALGQADGRPRWQRRINTEILSAPAVGDDFVVVRGVDGRMQALTTRTGTDSWIVTQDVPRLSLRGTSSPLLIGDLAICAFDNGHVMAVDRTDGMTVWNVAVAQPHGSSELQRLIDIDSSVVPYGDELYAVAYQGRVASLLRDSGRSLWSHDLSSYRGLTVDADAVYVSSADGTLVRLNRRTGAVDWQQKVLANRQLSAPALYRGWLVVGDLQGYVHWFDPANGRYLARVRIGKHLISATPVVADGLLLVFDDDGDLSALRAPAPSAAANSPPAQQTRAGPPVSTGTGS